jgi:lysophospholipase L1-like esterase
MRGIYLPKKWFIENGLHMTEEGYQLWTKILTPYIKE